MSVGSKSASATKSRSTVETHISRLNFPPVRAYKTYGGMNSITNLIFA